MRTFYLFNIKSKILKEYRYNYEELYSILESIHYKSTDDILLCYEVYNSIINPINKDKYNSFFYKKNISNECYICYNYIHNYNDYLTNENTKMLINNSYIKIDTNKNLPIFLNELSKHKKLFVCDFDHHDYFMLDSFLLSSCISV